MNSVLLLFSIFPIQSFGLSTISLNCCVPHTQIKCQFVRGNKITKRSRTHKMLLPFQGVHQGKALKLFHFRGCMAKRGGATPHIATLENNICTETEPLGPARLSPPCLSPSLRWKKDTSVTCCFPFPVHVIMTLRTLHSR